MKKLLFLLLSLAVATTASAGLTKSPMQKKAANLQSTKKVESVVRGKSHVTPAAIQFDNWTKNTSHILRSREAITWDFEDADQFAEFMAVDNDGDGFNWQYYNNEGLTSGLMTAHDGYGLVASASYDNDSGTALTPDNWLVSPEVTLGGALTFWAMGQDDSYAAEKFAVYVCVGEPTGPDAFTLVAGDFTATDTYVQYEIDLSAYQGQVGRFAIVHHNITDMFFLNVDDIVLDASAVALPYPVIPTVTVTPDVTSAMVNWGADEGAEAYDLRWRPWTDLSGNPFYCGLDNPDEDLAFNDGWGLYDGDGDGYNWGYGTLSDENTVFYSASWTSSAGDLSPENYLFSPTVKLEGKLKFKVWTNWGYGEEHLAVLAMYGEDGMDLLTEEDITVSNTDPQEYEFDLSGYEGIEGYIAFVHYNCTGQYYLFLDDIFIGDPDAEIVEPAAWNYEYDITNNYYEITGLTPETKYEVQVMGKNASHESDWCDIVGFTTLAEPVVETPDVYMIGGNAQPWDPTSGFKFEYNEEDNIYTLNYTFPDETNYFGFTTRLAENNDDGGWAYIEPYRFGAVADGENFIYYDNLYDGQPLDLTWDAYKAFQIGAGEYDIVVDLTSMKVILTKVNVEPPYLRGDVDNSGDVKIADVTALINYLLSGDATNVNLQAADCDESGDVKIADVTALINYLLSGSWPE